MSLTQLAIFTVLDVMAAFLTSYFYFTSRRRLIRVHPTADFGLAGPVEISWWLMPVFITITMLCSVLFAWLLTIAGLAFLLGFMAWLFLPAYCVVCLLGALNYEVSRLFALRRQRGRSAREIASTLPWKGEGSLIEIAEAKRFLTTVRH